MPVVTIPTPYPSSYSLFSTSHYHHVDCDAPLSSSPVSEQLLEAAACANEKGVTRALLEGADINVCDSKGRTIVGYVIGGER